MLRLTLRAVVASALLGATAAIHAAHAPNIVVPHVGPVAGRVLWVTRR
jgi:Spy/CpxP family protein refolding chaperone